MGQKVNPNGLRLGINKDWAAKWYANKIDFIETGAAPMPLEDMRLLCQVLPQTRLYNTYASPETGIISIFNYNNSLTIIHYFQYLSSIFLFISNFIKLCNHFFNFLQIFV